MTRHVVATVGEIAPGSSKLVTVKGREIAVFNVGGNYFAFFNRCPHAGASLCHGSIIRPAEVTEPGHYKLAADRPMLRCPCMAGSSSCVPARPGAIRRRSRREITRPPSKAAHN
ncbi:MAG TPA: Rieske 2Fe-2S domain-containing protein [Stellaceae bacterium]|jgi:nitrite reductase/ring-hydroxylating ferredoxin subunit|nr:Rieske 2Fe-2S domain-containing protein [Stellaceae bacterium]